MRKFRNTLQELFDANKNGTDFICAIQYKRYAKNLNFEFNGIPITCHKDVPKDEIFFINYSIDKVVK